MAAAGTAMEQISPVTRLDRWWVSPIVTAVVYAAFVLYGLVRVFENNYSHWGPYLAPFYSPELPNPGLPLSAAFFVAWMPLGFRATCYYYRKSYYRAFFWDPPACAVAERKGHYRGETSFPFILNNLHRFFLYTAIVIGFILLYDAFASLRYEGQWRFGLGSAIFFVNAAFILLYTFSCHSFRHLVGGNVDCYSCAAAGNARHGWWSVISRLNKNHGVYAWVSMFTVWGADLYVRQLAAMNVPVGGIW